MAVIPYRIPFVRYSHRDRAPMAVKFRCCRLLLLVVELLAVSHALTTDTWTPRLKRAVTSGLLVQPKPNIYVLGTVHIGSESAVEAEELIRVVQPDTVIVEVAPSRLSALQRRLLEARNQTPLQEKQQPKTDTIAALLSWPDFAARGWSAGGLPGLVFVTVILWPGFVRRSWTVREEETELPRRDEFAATVEAALSLEASPTIVGADVELDEWILECSQALSLGDWIHLAYREGFQIPLGLRPRDPIRRKKGESIREWATRRRRVETARASKRHGEAISSSLSCVIVDRRDARLANACREVLEEKPHHTIVCIVGLVHVEGICARL